MKIREVLLDAKKTLGAVVAGVTVGVPAAVAAGLIDNAQAAEIVGVAGFVSTALGAVLVYGLENIPKPSRKPKAT